MVLGKTQGTEPSVICCSWLMNGSKRHIKKIVIRYSTPSRKEINIVVSQLQNAMGEWQSPTILFNGPMSPILESSRYAKDVGVGLIIASFYCELMMRFVSNGKAAEDLLDDEFEK